MKIQPLVTPWSHQMDAFHFAEPKEAALLAMKMGHGKTLASIMLSTNWGARKTLILTPRHVGGVWVREYGKYDPTGTKVHVAMHRNKNLKRRTEEANRFVLAHSGSPVAVVINYESAWRAPFAQWAESQKWDVVICDESHRIKAGNTKVSRWAGKLYKTSKRRLALTGTPLPHSPLDIFGQARFLDPSYYGRSYHKFSRYFAERRNPYVPQQITGYCNLDKLRAIMSMFTFQTTDDTVELPPVTHQTLPCSMPPKAVRIYYNLVSEACAELERGELTIDNALEKTIRLRQAVSGFLAPDFSKEYEWIHTAKEDTLHELLSDLDEPVVVYANFRPDFTAIRRVTERLGRRYGEVSGARHDITDTAEYPEDIDVLALQYQSGGVGLDLQRARIGVIYSQTYGLGDFQQSLKRIHRPGQTRPVIYYHLIVENTIDEAIQKALADRQDIVQSVLDDIRRGQSERVRSREMARRMESTVDLFD